MRITVLFLYLIVCVTAFGQQNSKLQKKFTRFTNEGKTQKAEKVMRKICEGNARYYFSLLEHAKKAADQKDYRLAALAINQALACNSFPFPATSDFFDRREREFRQSVEIMDQVIKRDSTADHFGTRATLWQYLKENDAALSDYSRAISLDSSDYVTFYNRGCIYNSAKRLKEAEADFTRAIELNDDYENAYLNRGFVRLQQERFDYAIDDLKAALGLATSGQAAAFCYSNIGYAYLQMGELIKAEENVRESIRLLPTNSYAYRNLALISLEQNDMENVCKHIDKSLELGFSLKYGDEVNQLKLKYCK